MNLRSYIQVEVIRNERIYHFFAPLGSPFNEARDVAQEIIEGLNVFEKQQLEQQKEQAESPEIKTEGSADGL